MRPTPPGVQVYSGNRGATIGSLSFFGPRFHYILGQIALVLALAYVACRALAAQDDSAIQQHFRAGQQAAAQQDFVRAITEFQAVLKLDPTLLQARANLGLMYFSTGQYSEAAQQLAPVTKAQPDIFAAQLFLGLSRFKLGQVQQAISPLLIAQQQDPSNREAPRALFSCYLSLRDFREASRELQLLTDHPDSEETLLIASQAYLQMGQELTRQLARSFGTSKWAHRLAGDLAVDRGDAKVAADEYHTAVQIDAQDTDLKALSAALANWQASDTAPLDTPCHSAETQFAGCISLLQKQYSAATASVASLFATNATAETLYKAIRVFTAIGEAYSQDLTSSYPDSASAHQLRGAVERLRQNFRAALQEFQLASTRKPEDAGLRNSSAEMDLVLDDEEGARRELAAAARIDPGNSQTEYLLAQLALKQKNTPEAIAHLKAAESRDAQLLEVHALLGTAYMRLGKPELAITELQKAGPVDYRGDLHFLLFKAYRALGKTELAEQALSVSKQIRAKSLQSAVTRITGDASATIADADSN